MGGNDDPTNIIELTVEEHAEEHRKLYEQHGKWQDFIAWKGLEGRIGKEEIERLIHIQNGLSRRGIPQTPEHIEKRICKIRGENNGMFGRVGDLNPMYGKVGELSPHFGKKHSNETCKKKSIALKNISYEELHGVEKAAELKKKLSVPKSEEHKSKLRKPKPKVVTRICDKRLMPLSNFMWWNKRQ
jgi:hypothetical protein